MSSRTILLVEDDANDVFLVRRALAKVSPDRPLHVVGDGDEAVAYLAGTPPFSDRSAHPLPAVVLLDLKLPRRSGTEVLEWMRQQPGVRRIPVVMLTASSAADDVARAYDAGANSYLVKPTEFSGLRGVMAAVDEYWLGQNVVLDAFSGGLGVARASALGIRRIAVVDDDPDDRALVRREIARTCSGYEVVEIGDREAWDALLLESQVDVVVTDYRLRWSDGIAVARDIRARREDVVVVLFTASGSEAVAAEAVRHGIDDYVIKSPAHASRLAAALVAAAERAANRRAIREIQDERVRLLQREQEARAEAERASRLKDEFLATLSHELRTPLHALLGWVRLTQARAGEPELVAQGLATIERNARMLNALVADLLDVSRIAAGRMQLRSVALDLHEVVRAAVEVARPAADAKGIALNVELPGPPPTVRGDPERLQQVLWNLLSNAVKFTDPGGRVDVRAARHGREARVEVRDTGPGIASDFLPHVFERFRQGDASATRPHGGLGLGLAIARELVELQGGRITASSPGLGKGATFTVALPATDPLPEA